MSDRGSVIGWLVGSDPSIRWQVLRDLLDVPESEWTAERAKVQTEGWGARLLSCADQDGQWAGGALSRVTFIITSGRRADSRGQPQRSRCRSCGSSAWIPLRIAPGEPSNSSA